MSHDPPKPVVYVLPTTHWDRAWYWTFQRFRVRLVELIECVLEEMDRHPDYRFVMDGQAIPLDDYLEAMPGRREVIGELMRSGRLQAGPMFTLPDHFCTGGESFLRNLLLGEQFVEEMGGRVPEVLYLPDSFGFPSDLPMVASGSGYRVVSFMRGLPPEVPEDRRMFLWESADGSCVRVFRLRDGYGNAACIGNAAPGMRRRAYARDKAVEDLLAAAARQDDGQGGPLVLLAGIDHMLPQPGLDEAMRAASARGGYQFCYATLSELAERVLEHDASGWFRYRGEFRSSGCGGVLGGTVSTRIFLKKDNAEIERMLVHVAEPIEAITALLGRTAPCGGVLRVAWKRLLTMHPHDDITGCSVDKVHEDDGFLMDEARDGADAVRRRCADVLMEFYGGYRAGETRYGFFLINAQPFSRRVVQRVVLDFEGRERWGDEQPPGCYAVVDEAGAEVPFVELGRGRSREHPHHFLEIELCAELPPFEFCRFYLEPRDAWGLTPGEAFENERVRVSVGADAGFDLEDLHTGDVLRGVGFLTDQGDCGDAYDFCDIHGDSEQRLDWQALSRTVLPGCGGCRCQILTGSVSVPERSDRFGRSSTRRELPVALRLTLFPGEAGVAVDLTVRNEACDHRLRWNIEWNGSAVSTRAGQKFGETTHPVRPQPVSAPPPAQEVGGSFDAAGMGRPRTEARIHPEFTADQFIAMEDAGRGVAVFTEFPVNYEVVAEGSSQRLAVTVLRAVGCLSRRAGEMSTRTGAAGPSTPTPGAQMPGREIAVRFLVRPFAPTEAPGILREALLARTPAIFGLLDAKFDPWDGSPPAPLLHCDNPQLLVSAFKISQDGERLILRLLNPTDQTRSGRLKISGRDRITPCLHTERPTGEALVTNGPDGEFVIEVPPHGMVTYDLGRCPGRYLPDYPSEKFPFN